MGIQSLDRSVPRSCHTHRARASIFPQLDLVADHHGKIPFVLGLLIYVIFRFNEKANPVPAQISHHSGLEVAWTVIPVLVLVVIAIPSFRLLTHQLTVPPGDITIKVTGHQWYWTYAYPKDQGGGFEFD